MSRATCGHTGRRTSCSLRRASSRRDELYYVTNKNAGKKESVTNKLTAVEQAQAFRVIEMLLILINENGCQWAISSTWAAQQPHHLSDQWAAHAATDSLSHIFLTKVQPSHTWLSRWVSCSAAKRCRPPMNDAQTRRGSFQLLLCACHILASSRINQQADILKGAAAATHPPHLFLTG